MASFLPNAVSEREALYAEAAELETQRQQREADEIHAKMAILQAELSGIGSKRWMQRRKADIQVQIQGMQQRLSGKTSRSSMRKRFETIEKKYSSALEAAGKSASGKLVSSSIHSATKTFRKSNVVLMAPENMEECVRQHLRAELGLQEAPLMLTPGDVCDECGVQMSVVSNDSMLSCPQCHKLRLLPNTMTTSALHGTDVESSAAITKHRLPEWIEMSQGKEFSEPPVLVLEAVARFLVQNKMSGLEQYAEEIREERKKGAFKSVHDAIARLGIPDLEQRLKAISSGTIRTALRGLVADGKGEKFRKFYERSTKISALVSGFWPPRMTGQQEETLRLLYTVAAPEYEKRRKPRQTYWPGGFPFFLRCLCVLLGWDEFAVQFPIPSGSKEGGARDLLRNEIWTELGWELVPYTGKLRAMTLPNGEQWSLTLDDEEATTEVAEARAVQSEVETRINIRKRRRVDFELECS